MTAPGPESLSHPLVSLPLRLPSIPLISNFYRPVFRSGVHIHVYSVHFTPDVDDENRALRGELYRNVGERVKKVLSGHIFSGGNLHGL